MELKKKQNRNKGHRISIEHFLILLICITAVTIIGKQSIATASYMQKEVIFTENHSVDEEDTDNSDEKMAVSTDEQEIILRENLSSKDYRNLTPEEVFRIMLRIKSGDIFYIKDTELLSQEDYTRMMKEWNFELILKDINHDGYDDLVWQENKGKKNINAIISYHQNGFECVVHDMEDGATTYYFDGDKNIIEYTCGGTPWGIYEYFVKLNYDKNWNQTPAYGLGIKNIYDIEEYGIDASDITEKGIYYTELVYLDELETLPLTEQQFLIKFSDMMGIDYDDFQNKE